jgi:hypothetical protein
MAAGGPRTECEIAALMLGRAVHHAIALGLHTTVLVLLKAALCWAFFQGRL